MKEGSRRIILGSGSPRRRELLAGLDLEFTVDKENTFEEFTDPDMAPEQVPVTMAEGKSRGFHRSLEDDEILITADTVVIIDGKVLGKPHGRQDAVDMLGTLSGKTHEVVTAVTIRDNRKKVTFSDSTLVTFKSLTDREIEFYVDKYVPFDKAGSYGVQEWIGFVAIERLEGSFYNVMGFPTHRVYAELEKFLQNNCNK